MKKKTLPPAKKSTVPPAVAKKRILRTAPPGDPIKHVVVLMLENRSFDHMLGSMKSLYPALKGIDPTNPGTNSEGGVTYRQKAGAALQLPPKIDPFHEAPDAMDQLNTYKQCGGFIHNFLFHYPGNTSAAQEVMNYFDRKGSSRLPALHTLAENFTICDHWFSSVRGPTWANRFYVHSGTSLGRVFMPTGIFHNWHLYTQDTIFDRLNDQDISWKVYHDGVPQSLVLVHQLEPLNAARYHGMDDFFKDARSAEEDFPSYSFIEPAYSGSGQNDQHPPTSVANGDALIASVYNAIRANADLWNSTLLIVLYDEHGGFYDDTYPPPATPPDNHTEDGFTFDQFGVRVPALLVSPWVARGFSSTVFDHTSILRYLIDKWNLDELTNRARNANSIAPLLASLSTPRTDTPAQITIPKPSGPMARKMQAAAALAAAPEELNDLQKSLVAFSEVLEHKTKDTAKARTTRSLRMIAKPKDQLDVANERLENFLAQQRRIAKVGRMSGK